MKKLPVFTLILIVLVTLGRIDAVGKPKPAPTPVPRFHTVIESISPDSITVKEPKQSKTYKITKTTSITFDDKRVTVADLKPGMKVTVIASMDSVTAEVITANKPPVDPAPPKKK